MTCLENLQKIDIVQAYQKQQLIHVKLWLIILKRSFHSGKIFPKKFLATPRSTICIHIRASNWIRSRFSGHLWVCLYCLHNFVLHPPFTVMFSFRPSLVHHWESINFKSKLPFESIINPFYGIHHEMSVHKFTTKNFLINCNAQKWFHGSLFCVHW